MWRISILLLICLIAVPAYSNPPSPAPSETKQKPQSSTAQPNQRPDQDQGGTVEPPPVIKIAPSLDADVKATEPGKNHNQEPGSEWRSSPEIWIAVFTGLLWVTTIALAAYTARLWSATNKSAEMLPKLERAYVFGKVEVVGSIKSTFQGTTANLARTLFVNHGKTPAIIINMSGAPYVMNTVPQQLARTPDDDRRLPEGWVIASGEQFQRPIAIGLTDPELKAIDDGTLKLYCAGLIRYKDILGDERQTGYCWEYLPEYDRFQFCKESHLNHYN